MVPSQQPVYHRAVEENMAEPFKNLISAGSIGLLAKELEVGEGFVKAASAGLEALELKARVRHVGASLRPFLASDWEEALAHLVAHLPGEEPNQEGVTAHFHWWPVLDLVETQGLAQVEASVNALARLTTRFSAEFAIRPYLIAAPEQVWPMLERWVEHPDLHVRRWLSEGTRPRLPWGMQIGASVKDPRRGLQLIEKLLDDPSSYVGRSVANHLGDIAKDHPELAVSTAERWLRKADRRKLVEHGLRSLLKKGDAGALKLFGSEGGTVELRNIRVLPTVARSGDTVEVEANLLANADGPVRTDLLWEWPAARSGWSSKVFRGETRTVRAGESWTYRHRLSLKPVTTRPLRPGAQRLTLRVNGVDLGRVEFLLEG